MSACGATNHHVAVASGAVLAMAQHQLKQADAARTTLAEIDHLSQTKLQKMESEAWQEWVVARFLLEEAKELIKVAKRD